MLDCKGSLPDGSPAANLADYVLCAILIHCVILANELSAGANIRTGFE